MIFGLTAITITVKVSDDTRSAAMTVMRWVSFTTASYEPKYTRYFLDALLDEFIACRQGLRDKAQGRVLQDSLQEVLHRQKTMDAAASRLDSARAAAPPTKGTAEIERLIARLVKLRDTRDDLCATIQSERASKTPDTGRQELKAAAQNVIMLENEIKQLDLAQQTLHDAVNYAKARSQWEKQFAEVEDYQKRMNLETDPVAIHERATPVSEYIQSHASLLISGGIIGGVLGGMLGLIAAFIVSWRPAKVVPLESCACLFVEVSVSASCLVPSETPPHRLPQSTH